MSTLGVLTRDDELEQIDLYESDLDETLFDDLVARGRSFDDDEDDFEDEDLEDDDFEDDDFEDDDFEDDDFEDDDV